VFVGVAIPGAAPDVVEREVVTRLEDELSGLSGVDKLNSTSTDGFAQIIIQFSYSKDVAQATQDVRDAIASVRAELPPRSSSRSCSTSIRTSCRSSRSRSPRPR
jgi:HAE1 family hydrophobic/amphiphilic exporter-1